MTRWQQIARETVGLDYAQQYAERFRAMADEGADVHGEATFVTGLVDAPATVLDAGCGTGRVAIRLAALGHRCTGVDVDPRMLDHARAAAPDLTWALTDLASPDLPAGPFDVVVAAGNVIPLLAPGTEAGVVAAFARRSPVLIAGFGLDAAHLPLAEAPFGLTEYDAWCTAAGLVLQERWSTWSRDPWDADAGYAVSVHVTPGVGLPPQRERL